MPSAPIPGSTGPRRSRHRRPHPGPAALLVVLTAAAAGCLGQSGGGTVPPGAQVVQIHQMAFRPRVVTVRVGQPVTWRFEDAQVEHDVDAANGSFQSPLRDSGTWTHTFSAPGTYSYFCSVHTYMTGVVVVTASTSTSTGG